MLLLPLFVLLPIFLYKLDALSLVSFDEAWYAAIARNILQSGDVINLVFNGRPFLDHPPVGFWLIALGLKIFGVNELGARVPSAIAGFVTILTLYFLGKKLFNPLVGFASAVALTSCPWFIFRARSGNLDAIFVMFFLLSFFLAFESLKNKKLLFPLALCLVFLFLTKTLIPLTIIPALIFILYRQKIKWSDFKYPAFIVVTLVGGWFIYNLIVWPEFWSRFLFVGTPGLGVKSDLIHNILLFKIYLHSGIGKWFWPGIFSIVIGVLSKDKRFMAFSIFFATFSLPFLFSHKGHIWHLIPLYPFMLLSFFGLLYILLSKLNLSKILIGLLILAVCLYFSFMQARRNWFEFIDIPTFVSTEEILGTEASKYQKEKLFVEGDILQAVVFYSNKEVEKIDKEEVGGLFSDQDNFIMIVHDWVLTEEKIDPALYEVIKKDRDMLLVKSAK